MGYDFDCSHCYFSCSVCNRAYDFNFFYTHLNSHTHKLFDIFIDIYVRAFIVCKSLYPYEYDIEIDKYNKWLLIDTFDE